MQLVGEHDSTAISQTSNLALLFVTVSFYTVAKTGRQLAWTSFGRHCSSWSAVDCGRSSLFY